jgi:hypothetical protein
MLKSTELMSAGLSAGSKIRLLRFWSGLLKRFLPILKNCLKCLAQANLRLDPSKVGDDQNARRLAAE